MLNKERTSKLIKANKLKEKLQPAKGNCWHFMTFINIFWGYCRLTTSACKIPAQKRIRKLDQQLEPLVK